MSDILEQSTFYIQGVFVSCWHLVSHFKISTKFQTSDFYHIIKSDEDNLRFKLIQNTPSLTLKKLFLLSHWHSEL